MRRFPRGRRRARQAGRRGGETEEAWGAAGLRQLRTPPDEFFDRKVFFGEYLSQFGLGGRLGDNGFPNENERVAHEGGWPDFIDAFERFVATVR